MLLFHLVIFIFFNVYVLVTLAWIYEIRLDRDTTHPTLWRTVFFVVSIAIIAVSTIPVWSSIVFFIAGYGISLTLHHYNMQHIPFVLRVEKVLMRIIHIGIASYSEEEYYQQVADDLQERKEQQEEKLKKKDSPHTTSLDQEENIPPVKRYLDS